MQVLVDTHALIWFAENDKQLPGKLRGLLTNTHTDVRISIVSFWKMGIKVSNSKLEIKTSLDEVYDFFAQKTILPVDFKDIQLIAAMSLYHRDPFDRMIIAQAINRDLAVISKDEAFDAYGVKRLW